MSTSFRARRGELRALGGTALQAAAQSWFLVAVIGQWIFVCYIAFVYGGSAARGNFATWNKILTHGYVPGNTIGNTTLAVHLLFAAAISFSGALQLVPQIRTRFPVFHRWNGRVYLLVAFTMGMTGLYLSLSGRKLVGDLAQHVAITVNGILIIGFAAMAWHRAVGRDFKAHRRWALRLFVVASGVWFFRVELMFWLFINKGPVGIDMDTFTGPFLTFLSFTQSPLPLVVLEIYLRAKERGGGPAPLVTAFGLFALTLVMAIGVFAATIGMWLPRMKGAW